MIKRKYRVTTRDILHEAQRKLRLLQSGDKVSTEAVQSNSEDEEAVEMDSVDSVASADDIVDLDPFEETEDLWKRLSEQDLSRLYFLLTTTVSKAAANRYFETEHVPNETSMKRILFENTFIERVEVCAACSEDLTSCSCENSSSPSELIFGDLRGMLRSLLDTHGAEVLRTQSTIESGGKSSCPMKEGKLHERFMFTRKPGEIRLHFSSSWDGIKLHVRGRQKCWPFTLMLLDLDDELRCSTRTVLLSSIYFGKCDPSSKIHDRITKWAASELHECIVWNGLRVQSEISIGVFDDPARRKVYGLKGFSSSGSCPYCYNQETIIKVNNCQTIIRDESNEVVAGMNDGLQVKGEYTEFHKIVPMYNSPIDFFHTFHEGIFDKIISEVFICSKLDVFKNHSVDTNVSISLPSHLRSLSNRYKEITGCEKALIYETRIVSGAIAGQIGGVASAIVIAFHALYRLNVSHEVTWNGALHQRMEEVTDSIAPIVETLCPELLRGSKVHQILYHLPKNVEKFGSIFPLSTQSAEHYYHTIQRHLCSEVTNGLGFSILRNMTAIQKLHSEVSRRIDVDPGLPNRCQHARKLSEQFRIRPKQRVQFLSSVPWQYVCFAKSSDYFSETHWRNGLRFSSKLAAGCADDTKVCFRGGKGVRYGKLCGFLVNGCDKQDVRMILEPYTIVDEHIRDLARRLFDNGLPRLVVQNVVTALQNPCFGARMTGSTGIICVSTSELLGHAVIVETGHHKVILPMFQRVMLS